MVNNTRNHRGIHGRKSLWSVILLAVLAAACARVPPVPDGMPAEVPSRPDRLSAYRQFVTENQHLINRQYGSRYGPVTFVVDTENGSAPIQSLVDTAAAADFLARHPLPAPGDASDPAVLTDLVRRSLRYVPEPMRWNPVKDTMARGRGDCKNLSLVLLSLLAQQKIPAHAGISNGHMWVVVTGGGADRIVELDTAPDRQTIYQIHGFYELPLYRIFPTHAEKRVRNLVEHRR